MTVMCLCGRFRKLQFVGELWVGSSRAQHAEHSELLRGQLRHALE